MSVDAEIDAFFETLFPDEALRAHVWHICASHVNIENQGPCVYVWVGTGCNGKSTLNQLMQLTFGENFVSTEDDEEWSMDTTSTCHYICNEMPQITNKSNVRIISFRTTIKNPVSMQSNLERWAAPFKARLQHIYETKGMNQIV
jgi:phage/plasmid-associated DNA primase